MEKIEEPKGYKTLSGMIVYNGSKKETLANYSPKEREFSNEIIDIRLYCDHSGCFRFIKGKEGYNGSFTAENGESCDLRNQVWKCPEHNDLEVGQYVILKNEHTTSGIHQIEDIQDINGIKAVYLKGDSKLFDINDLKYFVSFEDVLKIIKNHSLGAKYKYSLTKMDGVFIIHILKVLGISKNSKEEIEFLFKIKLDLESLFFPLVKSIPITNRIFALIIPEQLEINHRNQL